MAMKGVLCIPESFCITGATPSDCLVSYPGHSLGETYCRDAVEVFNGPSRLVHPNKNMGWIVLIYWLINGFLTAGQPVQGYLMTKD